MLGYTLNRITLFALVFVVGIVVDDSIIIAENMHRHFHMKKLPFKQAAIYAINEVGNPTILATFTVIAAFYQWLSFWNDGTLYVANANWSFYCDDAFIVCGINGYTVFRLSFIKSKR
jgi:preprotein translocase subunit SecF